MIPEIGEVSKECLAKHSNCPKSRLILSVHVVCHPGEHPQFYIADIIQGAISIDRRELDSLEESLENAYFLPDDHTEEFVHVARVEESGEWENFPAWSQYFIVTSFQDVGFGVEVPSDRDRLASDLQATRAELEETRHDLAKFQRSERVLAEMLREKVAELEMVRRNHLRRMAHTAWLRRDYPRSTPISFRRRGQYDRFAIACNRAALATMENNK